MTDIRDTLCIREYDLSCRCGGEEFIAFLPNTDCNVAQVVANRIMVEIREAKFVLNSDFLFSVSIGIFLWHSFHCTKFVRYHLQCRSGHVSGKQNRRDQVAPMRLN